MMRNSIERRVFLLFGSFTLILALLYSIFSIVVAYSIEDQVLENVLRNEALYLEQAYQSRGELVEPRVDYINFYSNISSAPKSIQIELRKKPRQTEVFTETEDHFHVHWLTMNKGDKPLLVANVTEFLVVSNLSNDLLYVMIGLLCLSVSLAVWLAFKIARFTTQPVMNLAKEVMAQQDKEHNVVLSRGVKSDEVNFLAETIETLINNLKGAIKREEEFTRNVSHELRTPLTVAKNSLAVMELGQCSSENVDRLTQSITSMDAIISILLALARSESMVKENLRIRSIIEEQILSLHPKLVVTKFDVILDIPDSCCVVGNVQLVQLLFKNLIDNAASHSERPELVISFDSTRVNQGQLVFENAIGVSDNEGVKLLTSDILDTSGMEHGLYLVKRIIEALDWSCDIKVSERKFRFTITF